MICLVHDMPISCVCKSVSGTFLNSCSDLANIRHMMRNHVLLKPLIAIVS